MDDQTLPPDSTSSDSERELPSGAASIGRFQVLDTVGAGGMGVVMSAYDPELDRRIALKVLHPGHGSDVAQRRLQLEAKAMARLSHPNVVTVFEVGEIGERVYVAMELVDGVTLDRHLKARPHRWNEIVALFVQAGRGLVAAHAKGLVHRDFKPGNVLVDREGRVRVGDFGLARLAGDDAAEAALAASVDVTAGGESTATSGAEVAATGGDSHGEGAPAHQPPVRAARLTASGALLGTLRYMAPEQFAHHPATARSDQYSFCVALWEALFGEHPYAAGKDIGGAAALVPGARLRPAPRGRAPRAIVQLVARGLRVAPDERHPSMVALVDALEAIPRRRRRLAIGSAGVLVAVATAVGAVAVTRGDSIDCASAGRDVSGMWTSQLRAGLAARFAGARPYGADAAGRVVAALDGWTGRWRDARVDSCRATHERGEQSAGLLDRRTACLERGRLALASLLAGFATVDGPTVDNALAAATALPPPADCDTAVVAAVPTRRDPAARAVEEELAASQAAWNLARRDESARRARAALEGAKALGDSALEARALAAAAQRDSTGDPAEARTRFEAAQVAAARAQDPALEVDVVMTTLEYATAREDAPWIAATLPVARTIVAASGRPEHLRRLLSQESQALAVAGKAQDLPAVCARLAKVDGATERELSACRCRSAASLRAPDAVERCEDALRQLEAHVGAGHPAIATGLQTLALVYLVRGETAHARELLGRALAIAEAGFGRQSAQVANILSVTATSFMHESRTDEAERLFRESLAIHKALDSRPSAASIRARMTLAETLVRAGKVAMARDEAAEAMRLAELFYDPQHRVLTALWSSYAIIAQEAGDHAKAFEAYQRSEALARIHYGDSSSVTLLAIVGQAQSLLRSDPARAVILAQRAIDGMPRDGSVSPRNRAYAMAILGEARARSGDRARGRKDLVAARDLFASLGAAAAAEVKDVDGTLRELFGR